MTIVTAPQIEEGSPLWTSPRAFTMATSEYLRTPSWNTASRLATGDSPSDPEVTVWDVTLNAQVTLPDAPEIVGDYIVQPIYGTALVPRHQYLFLVTFVATPSNNTWTSATKLWVPL